MTERSLPKKARDLINASLQRLEHAESLSEFRVDVTNATLVVGGGIAGITAALALAENGVKTYLVEKEPSIGGNTVRIGKVFSPHKMVEECAMCSLSPLMNDVYENHKIELLTDAEIANINGTAGHFNVDVKIKPQSVSDTMYELRGVCDRLSNRSARLVERQHTKKKSDLQAFSTGRTLIGIR